MLAGTGSDVGKSVLAAALCRIFRQDGYHPAPFKAQNMALNSFATPDGLEIGRAQAMQAECAGISCSTDMNPLLLKPQSDHSSQVVLHGRAIGSRDAYRLWRENRHDAHADIDFRREVCQAFDRLSQRYNPIVMEGAGSISELNLRDHDIVNMPMARHAGADVILVADIDRGGVFASVYGSIMLQTPEDRKRIKGIIINKFRGDMRLFDEGRRMMEELCHVPVLGVVPYFKDIQLDDEDSVALDRRQHHPLPANDNPDGKVNIAVVRLPHISNYTDFDNLERNARVHLYYSSTPEEIMQADIIILPGTKSTMADLQALHDNGCANAVVEAHRQGKTVVGVCGGYQMMGVAVLDPDGVEGSTPRIDGLGLLPVTTTMQGTKTTRQTAFRLAFTPATPLFTHHSSLFTSYEIHMGLTTPVDGAPESPFALLDDGRTDGYVVDSRCMGTYLHGLFDNSAVVDLLLATQPSPSSAVPYTEAVPQSPTPSYHDFKQQQYDLLAAHVRQHVDIEKLYTILKSND